MADLLPFLQRLKSNGVTFVIYVPGYGMMNHNYCATPEDLVVYNGDPEAIQAKASGVTKEQFLQYMASEGCVTCAASTRTGKRCKNRVKGGAFVTAQQWVAMQGDYCVSHSEGTGSHGHFS